MSRNSKNAKLTVARNSRKRAQQQGKTIVSNGPNGPKKTQPKHGKRNAWWQKPGRPIPWWDKRGEQRRAVPAPATDV